MSFWERPRLKNKLLMWHCTPASKLLGNVDTHATKNGFSNLPPCQ